MRFTPKTAEELEALNLMKPGAYAFRVANAEDKVSKSGNEMIKLTLEVFSDAGQTYTVFDHLLEAMPSKLNAFCKSTKLTDKYSSGRLTSHDCIDRCGWLEIINKKGNENPQGGFYPDKNDVKTYLADKPKGKEGQSVVQAKQEVEGFDDDLPF